MMRERDPYIQELFISKLNEGHDIAAAAELTDCSESKIRRTMQERPEFGERVAEAITSKFTPIYRTALILAADADAIGENAGSHQAMALLFKHEDNAQGRKNAITTAKIKAAGDAALAPTAQPALTPAAVESFGALLLEQREERAKQAALTEADGVVVLSDTEEES